jgi:hypothetical protein
MPRAMKPLSFLCLLLLVSSAIAVSPSETGRVASWRSRRRPTLPDDDFLAGLRSHQRWHAYTMRRLPCCQRLRLHARRLPMPPPGRDDDGEEIDARATASPSGSYRAGQILCTTDRSSRVARRCVCVPGRPARSSSSIVLAFRCMRSSFDEMLGKDLQDD